MNNLQLCFLVYFLATRSASERLNVPRRLAWRNPPLSG